MSDINFTSNLPHFLDALGEARERARIYQDKYHDIGSLAAALGYDAINAENHGQSGSYTVILNRTKVIFRRP